MAEIIIERNVEDEVKQNKLNYSYSINLYRSFPNLYDGLKVVNRRILYCADKMKLDYNKPHKKSVALLGTTIVYHPHSDSAIYDACAKMVQPFYLNNPLLDGQGSWGSPSGDGAAASRYCITGDSLILTEKGLIKIKDLYDSKPNTTNDISLYVPSIYNKVNHASKFFNCGVHPVKTITTKFGFEITGTGNHPLMTLSYKNNKLKLEWKLIDDITKDDIIVLNGNRYKNNDISKDKISLKEARFLAMLCANVYRSKGKKRGKKLCFYMKKSKKEEEYLDEFVILMKELYPQVKWIDKGRNGRPYTKQNSICLFLEEIKYSVENKYSIDLDKNKFPKLILESSKEIQKEFIKYFIKSLRRCYIGSDSPSFILKSFNKEYAVYLKQLLFNSFNIISYIYSISDTNNIFRITSEDTNNVKKFSELMDDTIYTNRNKRAFTIPYLSEYLQNNNSLNILGKTRYIKNKQSLIDNYDIIKKNMKKEDFKIIQDIIDNDFYFFKVANISDQFEDTVYSIRVDSDCHSFIANGMINHNTEVRLSRYGQEMLEDLYKNTVNWTTSTLGDDKEPVTLPVKYPNLLINGAYGIGQGYNSFVPTHNFNEVADITIELINNPELDQEEIIKKLAPDFPLGGIVINGEEMKDVYRKGFGVCKVRGEVIKDDKNNQLIIKSFPHVRTNLNSIKDAISDKLKDGYFNGISDIKDLTKKGDINLIIKAKRGYSLDKLEQELYKLTPLQSTLSLSLMCTEDDKSFRHYSIKEILTKWIDYRKVTIKRSLNFDMAAINKRLHIIEALLKALRDIDKVISIIKQSENKQDSINNLMKEPLFEFNTLQARYIVDLPLSQLSKIGKVSLQEEEEELNKKLSKLRELFTSDKKLSKKIIKELEDGKKKFGKERKTKVTNIDENSVEVVDKDYMLFLTKQGFIKKLDLELNTQASNTKGRKCGKLRNNDVINTALNIHNKDTIVFFTNKGNCYGLKAYDIEEVGLNTLGLTLNSLLTFKEDEYVVNMINVTDDQFSDENKYLVFATHNGLIKKTKLTQYQKVNKNALIAIKLQDGDYVKDIIITEDTEDVLLATNMGKYSRYSVSELSASLRMTMGVICMGGIQANEYIVSMTSIKEDSYIVVIDKEGLGKKILNDDIPVLSRTNKGRLLTKTNTQVVSVSEAKEDSNITIITKEKMLKIKVADIKEGIRTSKGKACVNLSSGDEVLDMIIE